MDFRRDPEGFDFSLLSKEASEYLVKSGATGKTPIIRLEAMNRPAIELFRSNGIDLYTQPLEIDVCAQHNNGGLAGNIDYESTSLRHFFIVGEANGVFGIRRPGGSALNSTQVSSLRAAQKILRDPEYRGTGVSEHYEDIELLEAFRPKSGGGLTIGEILELRRGYGEKMTRHGAFIRDYDGICETIDFISAELDGFYGKYRAADPKTLIELSINHDVLVTQLMYLSAIKEYVERGGKSRGSYLIAGVSGLEAEHSSELCYALLKTETASDMKTRVRYQRASHG